MKESRYFFCDKFAKQIAKDICIHRQKMLDDIADLERLHNCRDCEQGKGVAGELKVGGWRQKTSNLEMEERS